MRHLNNLISIKCNPLYAAYLNLSYPEIYSATSIQDFLKEKDKVIPTSFSPFLGRRFFEGGAVIIFDLPVMFHRNGTIRDSGSKSEGGSTVLGKISDITGKMGVFANGRYAMEREDIRALKGNPRLFNAQICYHPREGLAELIDFDLHSDWQAPEKEKKLVTKLVGALAYS